MKEKDRQIEAMKKIGMTDDEIAEVLESDRKIDKGEKLFQLAPEQEKTSKKARQVAKAPTIYKLDNKDGKRSKKEDNDKANLMKIIETAISGDQKCESYTMTNPEREMEFVYNGRKFKIVLSAPRK